LSPGQVFFGEIILQPLNFGFLILMTTAGS
jgi:hypothetical protein